MLILVYTMACTIVYINIKFSHSIIGIHNNIGPWFIIFTKILNQLEHKNSKLRFLYIRKILPYPVLNFALWNKESNSGVSQRIIFPKM